jgi:hypothetical protein
MGTGSQTYTISRCIHPLSRTYRKMATLVAATCKRYTERITYFHTLVCICCSDITSRCSVQFKHRDKFNQKDIYIYIKDSGLLVCVCVCSNGIRLAAAVTDTVAAIRPIWKLAMYIDNTVPLEPEYLGRQHIGTKLRAGQLQQSCVFRSSTVAKILSSLQNLQILGPNQSLIQGVPGVLSQWVNRPELEGDYLPPIVHIRRTVEFTCHFFVRVERHFTKGNKLRYLRMGCCKGQKDGHE